MRGDEVEATISKALGRRPYLLRRVGVSFNVYALRARGTGRATLTEKFSADAFRDRVLYVEPNSVLCVENVPNDPLFGYQWALKDGPGINAVAAWDYSMGTGNVVVGVIDTGIEVTHPDLKANLWSAPPGFSVTLGIINVRCPAGAHGYNSMIKVCVPDSGTTSQDGSGHGTHVAGIIGAVGNNNIGVAGVNWHTSLMALKALNGETGTVADIAEAIEFAIQAKRVYGVNVRALNNSYGKKCSLGEECPWRLLEDEIRRAAENDILFVASAGETGPPGNDNDASPHYPSGYELPNIISVAWTTKDNTLNAASNFGLHSVDIGAPGSQILSTSSHPNPYFHGEKYYYLGGSSMSAAFVSGAAALVLSRCPNLDTAGLKDILLRTVDPLPSLAGKTVTGGRLNVYKAVKGCTP